MAISFSFFYNAEFMHYNAFDLIFCSCKSRQGEQRRNSVCWKWWHFKWLFCWCWNIFLWIVWTWWWVHFQSRRKGCSRGRFDSKYFIWLMVVFHQSLIAWFFLHHCWSSSNDGVKMNLTLVGDNFLCLLSSLNDEKFWLGD